MNHILWDIGVVEGPVTPSDPLPPMPVVPKGAILVIGGRGPIWRFGFAFHEAHGCPAAAVASYDPRLGAVVVASHSTSIEVGSVLAVEWPS